MRSLANPTLAGATTQASVHANTMALSRALASGDRSNGPMEEVAGAQDTIYLCNFRVSVDGEWLCLKELQDLDVQDGGGVGGGGGCSGSNGAAAADGHRSIGHHTSDEGLINYGITAGGGVGGGDGGESKPADSWTHYCRFCSTIVCPSIICCVCVRVCSSAFIRKYSFPPDSCNGSEHVYGSFVGLGIVSQLEFMPAVRFVHHVMGVNGFFSRGLDIRGTAGRAV